MAGPYIMFSGFIFSDIYVVQPFTDYISLAGTPAPAGPPATQGEPGAQRGTARHTGPPQKQALCTQYG